MAETAAPRQTLLRVHIREVTKNTYLKDNQNQVIGGMESF